MIVYYLDFSILDWIRANLTCPFLDAVMPRITALGNAGIFWIILTILLLMIPRTRKLGAASAIALVLDLLLVNITIKPLVDRIRPFALRSGIQLIVKAPTDPSFPSGHTASSFASALSLLFSSGKSLLGDRLGKRLGIPAVILAAVIAFSRLYLYLHYPSDVLGGILCGVLCGMCGAYFAAKLADLYHKKHTV